MRAQYKAARQTLDPSLRGEYDAKLVDRVKALPEGQSAKVWFVYLSRNGEADTRQLVQVLLEAGKTVLTPSPDIRALPHDGLFQVYLEEDGGHSHPVLCNECRVAHVDVIVVPGIVWDRHGYRIGFGGGYFDRLLSMARPDCLKIGLAYSLQIADEVPRDSWDMAVDILITESETLRIKDAG